MECLSSRREREAPGGRARENRKFIQAPSPEIWSETISGGEEVLAGKWGWPVLGYLLGKNFRRRDRNHLVSPRRMDAAVCRAEVCYPFGREHGRHRAVRRRVRTLLSARTETHQPKVKSDARHIARRASAPVGCLHDRCRTGRCARRRSTACSGARAGAAVTQARSAGGPALVRSGRLSKG